MNAQYQAWEHGVKYSGATVHLVTSELDGGPIVRQEVVAVQDGDDVDSLSSRILEVEHRIYPEALEFLLHAAWRLEGRRLVTSGQGKDRGITR
jgi:phosphoribosylglycinamide formyltransferase-1